MRLLVTGGAGFIGSNYVRMGISGSLRDVDHITVLDALTYSGNLMNLDSVMKDAKYSFVKGDIRDSDLLEGLLPGHDAVVNFAAESHVDRSIDSRDEFISTNIAGTQVLLDSVMKAKVPVFLQISTDEVYGSLSEGSANEDSPLLPNSPYAASKAAADLLVRSYVQTFGLDARITRSSNNYGPFQFPEKLIPRFITNLINDIPVPVYGNGLNVRDWLHVDDNCRGIHEVLLRGQAGDIYNIGGGNEITNIEITKKLLEILKKDSGKITYVADRLGHDLRYSLDASHIQKKLGVYPEINFKEGLDRTVTWYLENKPWWKALI
jgi:dTDP-glucose 4,6-dehydratase